MEKKTHESDEHDFFFDGSVFAIFTKFSSL